MRKIMVAFAVMISAASIRAQAIDETLQLIEQNNLELQALKQQAEAAKLEVQTQNSLDDPSVEYSPFFTKGTSGMAMSELVVTQGFDFPTLYAARHSAGKYRQEALTKEYEAQRRDLLLSAKNLCLDLIRLNQENALIAERLRCAEELLSLFEKRFEEGDVSILDVNKIKMKRMDLKAEQATNNAAHREALQKLLAMNGNMPLEFTAERYPDIYDLRAQTSGKSLRADTRSAPTDVVHIDLDGLMDEVMATDASLQAANATLIAAQKEVSISRQGWLPKLEVGYRRNTEFDEKFNGFLVGGSLPIFTNRKKTKIAKAQALSAQLMLDDARLKAQAEVQSMVNAIRQTEEALAVYDLPLMQYTVDLLFRAVSEGQISIIEYYAEADDVYENMRARMEIECEYHKLLAAAYKNRL